MGRRHRHWELERWYHISNRCIEARYYLKPSKKVNRILLGCLTRYAEKYGIEVCCFVFMSNHFHLIARALKGNMSSFMAAFQREVAKRLNPLRDRENAFWGRRFSAEPILDDEAMLNMIAYTFNNPIKTEIVTHISLWEGLSSWDAHGQDGTITGHFLNYTKLSRLRAKDPTTPESAAMESHTIELKVPDVFTSANSTERHRHLVEFINKRQKLPCELFSSEEEIELAREVIAEELARHRSLCFSYRPKNPKRSRRPLCHTTDDELLKDYRKQMREITDAYRFAMGELRKGMTNVRFPRGTMPPGWLRCVGSPEPDPAPEEETRTQASA